MERLNRAIEQSASTMSHLALFGGMCGLGWTVEHLSHFLSHASERAQRDDSEGVEDDALQGDPCEDLDEVLIRRLQSGLAVAGYDLLHGHVGLGVYFLERWPGGRSIDGLRLVVDGLERLAERVGPDISWYSHPEWMMDKTFPAGCYNFGVAHGIPGVLHFLCQVARCGIDTQRVMSLLKRAISWFLAHASQNKGRARFSACVTPKGLARASRPVWCYGDLGIAAILSQIADLTLDNNLDIFAREMLSCCTNLPSDMYQVNDAGLCHGAAGVAHVYNRLYQAKGDSRYRDASVFWFERALNMFRPKTGIGGYSKYTRHYDSDTVKWEASPAFLDGSIGIALALLGAVTVVEPEWDRLLLLSSRMK